jgi:hypothetical protein
METRKRKSKNEDSNTKDKKKKSSALVEKFICDIEDKETEKVSIKQISKKKSGEKIEENGTMKELTSTAVKSNNGTKNWNKIETVLVKNYGSSPSEKILGFDLDDTLIVPKGSAKFAKDRSDWKFLIDVDTMKKTMTKYINEGYRIVIFTNQKGISNGKTDSTEWKGKSDEIAGELGLPL